MNERIKELEKLATPRCYDETGCYIGNRFDVEKFTELIVRECVHIAYNKMAVQKRDGIQPSAVCDAIREHFGVEE